MMWIVIEINAEGARRQVGTEYGTYDEACEVQEALETLHDECAYLVYSADAWMYECENSF